MSQPLATTLLDTDILSAVMRQHPAAVVRARAYLAVHQRLTFSIVTRYEILRGLYAKHATAQLSAFEQLCHVSSIVPLTDEIVIRAATIYADLHQRGALIGDADILIAATGLEHGMIVATNNKSHYQRITGIQLDNWLA
ncbi:VapC toxin family PIN domain ribonuclease [Candidatus Viridilinea mediisalina]|uniref:Ribonuclease VapC n=2 Tax=Candidatus Viridilinea mediisalina TaxID=2024553 RepID=A0A2A6RIR1_9CHLR|nr:VapC toxin family PIN domain ribonuclease [Candidatus Viridilinea mediisalina]